LKESSIPCSKKAKSDYSIGALSFKTKKLSFGHEDLVGQLLLLTRFSTLLAD